MITKFLLIVWFGVGNSQTYEQTPFDTEAECVAAAGVVKKMIRREWDDRYSGCFPYTFEKQQ